LKDFQVLNPGVQPGVKAAGSGTIFNPSSLG
jgi:hypothetical protein